MSFKLHSSLLNNYEWDKNLQMVEENKFIRRNELFSVSKQAVFGFYITMRENFTWCSLLIKSSMHEITTNQFNEIDNWIYAEKRTLLLEESCTVQPILDFTYQGGFCRAIPEGMIKW